MLSRRSLCLAVPLVLAGCNGQAPSGPSIAMVAQDVNLIAGGLSKALTQVQMLGVPGLTPQILNTCQIALTGVQGVAQSLAGVSSVQDAQPLIVRVEGYVNAIVDALAVLPLPPPVQTALLAATILLPVVEAAVNMAVPPAAATMTPDQARAALAK
jgi:hypothetical protein